MYSCTIVIPTYQRPIELRRCLESIFSQTIFPEAILVIDDDRLRQDNIMWAAEKCGICGIDWMYRSKELLGKQRGTSQSRNLALDIVRTDFMLILDDDIVLNNDFLESIFHSCDERFSKRLFGIGGIISNNRSISIYEKIFRKAFGLDSSIAWDVNDVGYQVWDDHVLEAVKGYYAHGGLFLYHVELLRQLHGFTELSVGRNALEDVDVFLRAKQAGYHLFIEPKAKALHEHTQSVRESSFATGVKEMRSRKYIFTSHLVSGIVSRVSFMWANVGWIIKTFCSRRYAKAAGMVVGLFV